MGKDGHRLLTNYKVNKICWPALNFGKTRCKKMLYNSNICFNGNVYKQKANWSKSCCNSGADTSYVLLESTCCFRWKKRTLDSLHGVHGLLEVEHQAWLTSWSQLLDSRPHLDQLGLKCTIGFYPIICGHLNIVVCHHLNILIWYNDLLQYISGQENLTGKHIRTKKSHRQTYKDKIISQANI